MRLALAILAASIALPTTGGTDGLGRAQLLPAGEFTARDGRPGVGKTWKLTDAQGAALAASVNAVAQQTPIVIDYDHQTLTAQATGTKAPAAGWIKRVEWLSGQGLFADVEWTAAAKAHIDAKEYRYISPVIQYDQAGVVVGMALAALVNFPALLGMEPAMTTALSALSTHLQPPETRMEIAALLAALGLAATATDAEITTHVAALRARPTQAVPTALATALGLQATADEAAALSAISTLKGGSTETVQLVASLQGQVATLTAQLNEGALSSLVEGAITAGKFAPAHRDWLMKQGRADFAALKSAIEAAPVIQGLGGQSGGDPGGRDPAGNGPLTALSSAQSLVAKQLGISPADYLKQLNEGRATQA